MKSIHFKFRATAVMALLFTLSICFVLPSCNRGDAPYAPNSNGDVQVRLADNWSGNVTIYLDQDAERTVETVALENGSVERNDAAVLVQTEMTASGPKIQFDRLQEIMAAFKAEHGETTTFNVRATNPEQQVTLQVDAKKLPFLADKLVGDTPEPDSDVRPGCGGNCQGITAYSIVTYTNGNFVFTGNCAGTPGGVDVINQALATCFAHDINVLTLGCPEGCKCDYQGGGTAVQKTRTCFTNGDSFTSQGCTLSFTGAVTITVSLTLKTGKCIKK